MKTKLYFLIVMSFLNIYSVNAQINEDEIIEDSILLKRAEEFLKPAGIYKNITNRISKSKLMKDINPTIITHRGGVDYYQINETAVGIRFTGQYLSEISFRYFGEQGLDYETALRKSGFLLKQKKKTSNLETEPNFEVETLDGEVRIYKKGNVVCQIYDGTYLGFTFYKAASK